MGKEEFLFAFVHQEDERPADQENRNVGIIVNFIDSGMTLKSKRRSKAVGIWPRSMRLSKRTRSLRKSSTLDSESKKT